MEPKLRQEELEERVRSYFTAFSNKDSTSLSKMFDKKILLRDWNVSAAGLSNVIAVNKEIFDSCNHLAVEVERIHFSDMTVIAEIKITIDDSQILVADFINFTPKGLISSVTAYRGN